MCYTIVHVHTLYVVTSARSHFDGIYNRLTLLHCLQRYVFVMMYIQSDKILTGKFGKYNV